MLLLSLLGLGPGLLWWLWLWLLLLLLLLWLTLLLNQLVESNSQGPPTGPPARSPPFPSDVRGVVMVLHVISDMSATEKQPGSIKMRATRPRLTQQRVHCMRRLQLKVA